MSLDLVLCYPNRVFTLTCVSFVIPAVRLYRFPERKICSFAEYYKVLSTRAELIFVLLPFPSLLVPVELDCRLKKRYN